MPVEGVMNQDIFLGKIKTEELAKISGFRGHAP